MLEPTKVERVAEEVARFIQSNGVRFERGEPRKYFTRIVQMASGVTLPIVPPEQEEELILLKSLFALWVAVVDDELDRDGTRNNLASSALLLSNRWLDRPTEVTGSPGALILDRLFSGLAKGRGRKELLEVFSFDVWDFIHGFAYQQLSRSVETVTTLEYARYSPMNSAFKQYLDMDCLFSESGLAPATYRKLRVAYDHFALAVRYANDVASLEREMEESSINLIRFKGIEQGILGPDGHPRNGESLETALDKLQPCTHEVRRLAGESLEAARRELEGVTDVDTSSVLRTISGMVKVYSSSSDPFFVKPS